MTYQPAPEPKKKGLGGGAKIGIGTLIAVVALGAVALSTGGGSKAQPVAQQPVPTEVSDPPASVEDSEPPAAQPTEAEEQAAPEPVDTSMKYGEKLSLTLDDVDATIVVKAPKRSTNMFDRDNLEAYVRVCNAGSDTITNVSAGSLGLYMTDKNDGSYDLYGPYRKPEFPVYSTDGKDLRKGKCMAGWIAFEDAKKANKVAIEVGDDEFTWSAKG